MGCIRTTGMWVRRHQVGARYGGELCYGSKVGEVTRRERRKRNTVLTESMSIGDKAGCGFDELGVIEEGTHIHGTQ
jgi:hypothetical protein